MSIPAFRTLLTKVSVLTSKPILFGLAGAFVSAWIIYSPGEIGWHEIATMATLFMTLLIQRAEHRDTQAIHATLDELLRANSGARNELAEIELRPTDILLDRRGPRYL